MRRPFKSQISIVFVRAWVGSEFDLAPRMSSSSTQMQQEPQCISKHMHMCNILAYILHHFDVLKFLKFYNLQKAKQNIELTAEMLSLRNYRWYL